MAGEERRILIEELMERNRHQFVWYEREMHKRSEGKKSCCFSIENRRDERKGGLLQYHFPPSTPTITPSTTSLSWPLDKHTLNNVLSSCSKYLVTASRKPL